MYVIYLLLVFNFLRWENDANINCYWYGRKDDIVFWENHISSCLKEVHLILLKCIYMIVLPIIYGLNLIMTKHQIKPNWEPFIKILGQYPLKVSLFWKTRLKYNINRKRLGGSTNQIISKQRATDFQCSCNVLYVIVDSWRVLKSLLGSDC